MFRHGDPALLEIGEFTLQHIGRGRLVEQFLGLGAAELERLGDLVENVQVLLGPDSIQRLLVELVDGFEPGLRLASGRLGRRRAESTQGEFCILRVGGHSGHGDTQREGRGS